MDFKRHTSEIELNENSPICSYYYLWKYLKYQENQDLYDKDKSANVWEVQIWSECDVTFWLHNFESKKASPWELLNMTLKHEFSEADSREGSIQCQNVVQI